MSQLDPLMLRDGCANLERGMDSGRSPSMIDGNQAVYLENVTVRGGFAATRPGWRQQKWKYYVAGSVPLTTAQEAANDAVDALKAAKFQGASFYDDGAGRGAIIVQASGKLYLLQFQGGEVGVSDISVPSDPNPTIFTRVFFCQADRYMLVQDGQNKCIIFDGGSSRRASKDLDEVPIGSGPMAYGMGRLWVAQGRNYVGGDLIGSDTGVLRFTENTYIAEGGAFAVPLLAGNITGMAFTAQPDAALGQGELIITTASAVFSNRVPLSRADWENETEPIQTILLPGIGNLSHGSMVIANTDMFLRSPDGIRSIIQARRGFDNWGNIPVSSEMSRVLAGDTESLLKYVSAIVFDNRLLMTCLPQSESNQCYFQGLVALDFDLISSMGQRSTPAYDGLWTGRDIYQVLKGRFNGIERAFAFCRATSHHVDRIDLTTQCQFLLQGTIVVDFTGGNPTRTAAATALMGVSYFEFWNFGTGYAVGDIVVIDGEDGVTTQQITLRVTAIGAGGSVSDAEVVQPGQFTTLPSDVIGLEQLSTTGSGVGLAITPFWGICGVRIDDPGDGYTSTPTVTFRSLELGKTSGLKGTVIMSPALELWEITKDEKFDYPLDEDNEWQQESIDQILESKSFPFFNAGSNSALAKRLDKGRLHVDQVSGTVSFILEYRPDQNPCWNSWHSWAICAQHCGEIIQCVLDDEGAIITPSSWNFFRPQYRPRMSIPQPPDGVDDASTLMPARIGREFQARLQWTGCCRIKLLELFARDIQEEVEPPVVATEPTCREVQCVCDTP